MDWNSQLLALRDPEKDEPHRLISSIYGGDTQHIFEGASDCCVESLQAATASLAARSAANFRIIFKGLIMDVPLQ